MMKKMRSIFQKKRESGATMVEYAIMVAVFAVALIAAVTAMRGAVQDGFEGVTAAICAASGVDCAS